MPVILRRPDWNAYYSVFLLNEVQISIVPNLFVPNLFCHEAIFVPNLFCEGPSTEIDNDLMTFFGNAPKCSISVLSRQF